MKRRVKTDSSILAAFIFLTCLFYFFPRIYPTSILLDNILDFLGIVLILKGVFFRMAARGHKKAHSSHGEGLVTTGLYAYTRNPMYLGSFMLGCGFVLMVWPWWMLIVFCISFYARFKRQVIKEEEHLKTLFGETYVQYCQKVPRIFPKVQDWLKMDIKKTFPIKELWSTKEKRGLLAWPCLAWFLETLQEKFVFGIYNGMLTLKIFILATVIFVTALGMRYAFSRN